MRGQIVSNLSPKLKEKEMKIKNKIRRGKFLNVPAGLFTGNRFKKNDVQKVLHILFISTLLFSNYTVAVDIDGDITIGLGGIPMSFEESIKEGENREGRSYINSYYPHDNFVGTAHLNHGNGVVLCLILSKT